MTAYGFLHSHSLFFSYFVLLIVQVLWTGLVWVVGVYCLCIKKFVRVVQCNLSLG